MCLILNYDIYKYIYHSWFVYKWTDLTYSFKKKKEKNNKFIIQLRLEQVN